MNSKQPPFKFSLSPDDPVLTPDSPLWSRPLPTRRHAFDLSQERSCSEKGETYGDYFTAVQDFLLQDNLAFVCDAVGRTADRSISMTDIDHIAVYLLKHGAFYHPACLSVQARQRRWSFVLNVAVSAQGRKMIGQEYQSLSRLNIEMPVSLWPKVFSIGRGYDLKGNAIPMFLGQWLDGYDEFHLTGEPSNVLKVKVWNSHGCSLTREQSFKCLTQAAGILTYAYNPMTFEAIRQWHHGAGDFVVALREGDVSLRLITVRNYAPLIDHVARDAGVVLEALLVFLVETSLKLRLDRLDGVGRMACYGDEVVSAIYQGFFQGLLSAGSVRGLPDDFAATVHEYIALHDLDQLKSLAAAVVAKMPFTSDEQDQLRCIFDGHFSALVKVVADFDLTQERSRLLSTI